MLSQNLEKTLHRALAAASERRHEYATLEHLLLALCDDTDAIAVMKACNVSVDQLRQSAKQFVDDDLKGLTISLGLFKSYLDLNKI